MDISGPTDKLYSVLSLLVQWVCSHVWTILWAFGLSLIGAACSLVMPFTGLIYQIWWQNVLWDNWTHVSFSMMIALGDAIILRSGVSSATATTAITYFHKSLTIVDMVIPLVDVWGFAVSVLTAYSSCWALRLVIASMSKTAKAIFSIPNVSLYGKLPPVP